MIDRANTTQTLRGIGTIVAISVFLAFTYNSFSPKALPIIRTEPKKIEVTDSVLFTEPRPAPNQIRNDRLNPESVKVIAPLHERALRNPDSMAALSRRKKEEQVYKVVTLEQVKRLLAGDRGIFIDAREPESYWKGHIKGARNIYGLEAGSHFEELVLIPRDTLIVIYCNNPECHLGRELAEFMSVMEFKRLYLYDDGWDGWEKAKMPIDTTKSGG